MANTSDQNQDESFSVTRAFLVVRRGGRWTDLLRLSPDRTALIGRASTNQIVIRSHQASRQHAEIRWDEGRWWVRDLGSRNGTLLNNEPVNIAALLMEGSRVEIAGCVMIFVTRMADALATPRFSHPDSRSDGLGQASDGQLTMDGLLTLSDIGTESITHRSSNSRFLDAFDSPLQVGDNQADNTNAEDSWQALFGLAYRLASAESIEEAAQWTLNMLTIKRPDMAGGIFLAMTRGPKPDVRGPLNPEPNLIAFTTRDNRSYRPPTPSIVQSVLTTGSAVIARDIADDEELQSADSRGEYSTTHAIVVPITAGHDKGQAPRHQGFLHLYTTDTDGGFESTDLEFTMAAAGVLGAAIENIHTRRQLTRSLRNSRKQIEQLRVRLEDAVQIIGESVEIKRVKSLISRVAKTNTTVLIRGESGVGKELVAASIHQVSPRRDAPMICLNCAALSPTLLESELFGHEKGAFTGATELKKGKFESADGGTLMLDEIGEMSIDLQAKLLRVLEGHPFERLGGHQPIRTNVRLIAATNRDLPGEVQAGRFRADLYYRLNVVEIIVPPLRERRDDILPVANHFLNYFSDKTARRIDGFTQRAAELMLHHDWPGNIRELRNVIERAVVLGGDATIDADDLNISAQRRPVPITVDPIVPPATVTETPRASRTLDELEREHILAVLQETGGNKSRSAIMLGIERSTLDRKLKRFGITRVS